MKVCKHIKTCANEQFKIFPFHKCYKSCHVYREEMEWKFREEVRPELHWLGGPGLMRYLARILINSNQTVVIVLVTPKWNVDSCTCAFAPCRTHLTRLVELELECNIEQRRNCSFFVLQVSSDQSYNFLEDRVEDRFVGQRRMKCRYFCLRQFYF